MLPRRRADWLALSLLAATTLVGLTLLPRLPAEVAIHFTAGGTPDDHVSPLVAVLLLPVITLSTIVVVRVAARVDPPEDPRSIDVLLVGVTAMLCTIHLLVLGWNLGYAVPMWLVVVGAVLWTTGLAAYVVVRETA